MRRIEDNVRKMKVLTGLQNATSITPVLVVYLASKGVSLADVLWLQALFSVAMLVLEVPSGYLSDRWGRKPTLVTGSVCGLAGVVVYMLGTSMWQFVIAELFLAALFAFHSGTNDALTRESLAAVGRENEYRSVKRSQDVYFFGSQAISAILGGLIATFSLQGVFVVEMLAFAGALVVTLTLVEPKRHIAQEAEEMQSMMQVFFDTIGRPTPLRNIIVISSAISLMTLTLFWFTQPYQQQVDFPLELYGVTHAIALIGAILMGKVVARLEGRVGDYTLLATVAGLVTGSFLLLSFSSTWLGVIWLVVGRSLWGSVRPIVSDLINQMVVSNSVRATVLSVQSFLTRLLFAGVAPLVALVIERVSLQAAIFFCGVVGGAAILVVFVRLRTKLAWN